MRKKYTVLRNKTNNQDSKDSMYYLYIIECSNNHFYIGYTDNIAHRYAAHCSGSPSCKYTRSFPPKRLAVFWQFEAEKGDVLGLEYQLKQLNHQQKRGLTECPDELQQYTTLDFTVGTADEGWGDDAR